MNFTFENDETDRQYKKHSAQIQKYFQKNLNSYFKAFKTLLQLFFFENCSSIEFEKIIILKDILISLK